MATLMSLIVYAGSAQFILVSLLVIGTPIVSIALSVFLVNSRMILMSMTTANFFKKNSLFENILLGSLITDESFALSMNKLNYTDGKLTFKWFNTVNVMAYLVWAEIGRASCRERVWIAVVGGSLKKKRTSKGRC